MRYAKSSGLVTWSGGQKLIREGDSIDNDHPLVAERPDLWTGTAPGADIRSEKIETGRQAPGQTRTERRITPPA